MDVHQCYCGSGLLLNDCCAPLLISNKAARTAEQLMRSRYSAYVVGNGDYLLDSWYPATRPKHLNMISSPHWIGLVIVDVKNGKENDLNGMVEFRATYVQHGKTAVLHERSNFVQEDGKWLYVNGTIIDQTSLFDRKVGRNESCPCGSGRKYKKCCLKNQESGG